MIKPRSTSNFGPTVTGSMRVAGFLALLAALTPVHLVYIVCRRDDAFRIVRLFHKMLLRMLGFHVRVHGEMSSASPILFVANHASYLDIPVLGALVPAAFVAKAEVASWPLFGILAKLQRTVFIERRPARTRDHKRDLRARLEGGQNLILFPEGTSSDGLGALPFKSALFGAIEEKLAGQAITVQPVSITCTELDGLPIMRAWRPYYAWYGDMTLVGHLWNVFKFGRFTVDVVFHAPVSSSAFANRKDLAVYCHRQVADGIERCLIGRELEEGLKILPAPSNAPATIQTA